MAKRFTIRGFFFCFESFVENSIVWSIKAGKGINKSHNKIHNFVVKMMEKYFVYRFRDP